MTLNEICVLTLRQLNEDEDALDELMDQLRYDINEGLNDLYGVYPSWHKRFRLEDDSGFGASELARGTARLVKLCLGDGSQIFWKEESGRIFALRERSWDIDASLRGCEVVASFKPLPVLLSNGGDSPELPERFHRALADYATFRMLSLGSGARQNRAEFFQDRYLRTRGTLSTWVNKQSKIANKY